MKGCDKGVWVMTAIISASTPEINTLLYPEGLEAGRLVGIFINFVRPIRIFAPLLPHHEMLSPCGMRTSTAS